MASAEFWMAVLTPQILILSALFGGVLFGSIKPDGDDEQ